MIHRIFNNTSLKYRITLIFALLSIFMSAIVLWGTLRSVTKQLKQFQEIHEEEVGFMLAELSRQALITGEYETLTPYVEWLTKNDHFKALLLTDYSGRIVTSTDPLLLGKPTPELINSNVVEWHRHAIEGGSGEIGCLYVQFSNHKFDQSYQRTLRQGISLTMTNIIGLLITSFIIGTWLSKRLVQLTQAVETISDTKLQTSFPIDGNDEVSRLAKQFQIMSQRVQGDLELIQEREQKYRSLFEDSFDPIYISSLDGKFIEFNQSMLNLFGYSAEEFYALSAKTLHQDPIQYEHLIQELQARSEVHNFQVSMKKKTGEPIDCLLSGRFKKNLSGDINLYQGILKDMTEWKRLEAQINQGQKMEAIGTLSGGIAHDFNNILSPIIGYTEMVRDSLETHTDEHADLGEVLDAATRAKDLIRQILTFSRQEKQEMSPISIYAVVNDALKFLRASIPTSIEIRQELSKGVGMIIGDPTQVHQVLLNLCANASHAMINEKGVLSVSLTNVHRQAPYESHPSLPNRGCYVLLEVADTGQGIDSAILPRIFEPFFTTKRTGEGTGMGLSVVHGIVEAHHGWIDVESTPGQGTRFLVYFPCIDESTEIPGMDQSYSLKKGKAEQILIIDDDLTVLNVLKRLLTALDYQVQAFHDPGQALQELQRNPEKFDLIITDMTMPKITGEDLVKKVRALGMGLPVIMCTGYSKRINKKEAKRIGVSAFLEKPVEKEILSITIRELLNAR